MDFSRLNYFPHGTKLFSVGSYPSGASAYGIMDMAGSVWEWTADWYSANYYKQSLGTNPEGPANGEYRVCAEARGTRFVLNYNGRIEIMKRKAAKPIQEDFDATH